MYHVDVSHVGEAQHISYTLEHVDSLPEYSTNFTDFKGSFEQWMQLSDAISVYVDFANNLNRSRSLLLSDSTTEIYKYSKLGDSYGLPNGSIIQTCKSKGSIDLGPTRDQGLWALSVFSRRMPSNTAIIGAGPFFDPPIAKDLLINTTISALSLNERFDTVNGTETRDFNVYRFENKLAFFLPYGLCLVLAVPMLALGLVALYVQNNGISAMSGGFLQLLMTTTGHTAVEDVIARSSGTLGGYENVSRELSDMELRFGELIYKTGAESMRSEERADSNGEIEVRDGMAQVAEGQAASTALRAGFGTDDEVRPLKRRNALDHRQGDF
ncbi:hypothetical protein DE146DRAFT_647407 [Phaeosphaeria sp. MPI-PUGE-AT-0046c]|nr:hypothetical protein DE146DRAFT_647407 [Phaeosphaeria sp. MPI-PUGE-AT-0046c]